MNPLTAPNSSADVFSKDFVPVQHTDYSALPFLKPSSTQHSGDGDKSAITKASHLGSSPMQISSPLVSSEAAYFNTFVPMEFKSDQISRDSCAYEDSHEYGRDVSADRRSSLDGEYFAYDEQIANERKRRKKVGRPIAYKGDPNASNLTEAERRRIKRRIANRESARRVRARRQGTLEELQVRMNYISAHNSEMVKHIAEVEGHTALLKGQLQQTELHWNRALADNARLHQQMAVLTARAELQVVWLLWVLLAQLSSISAHFQLSSDSAFCFLAPSVPLLLVSFLADVFPLIFGLPISPGRAFIWPSSGLFRQSEIPFLALGSAPVAIPKALISPVGSPIGLRG